MTSEPPGLWCPFATHKPIPEAWTQRAIDTRAVVVHSAGGHGELYGWWQSDASHGLESTFFICDDQTKGYLDGEIVQYLGVGIKADANGEANSFAASIETASSVSARERWTPAQAEALTRLLDWICTVAPKVERRLMDTPTDAGIAWHVQFGAPGPWTQVRGKVCPGPERIKQLRAEIIPAVAAMATQPTPTPPTPQPEGFLMALTDDEQAELLAKTRDIHEQWIGTKSTAKPETLRQMLKEVRATVADIASGKRPGR